LAACSPARPRARLGSPHFLEVTRRAGITNISEGGSLDDWAKAMGAK